MGIRSRIYSKHKTIIYKIQDGWLCVVSQLRCPPLLLVPFSGDGHDQGDDDAPGERPVEVGLENGHLPDTVCKLPHSKNPTDGNCLQLKMVKGKNEIHRRKL